MTWVQIPGRDISLRDQSSDGEDAAADGHVPAGRVDQDRIAAAVREILIAVGEDPDREGLRATPARVARMYAEIFSGLQEDPGRHLSSTFEADHDELVLVRDISIYSVCEHHLLPWLGKAHVAYIPGEDGRITGLSKLVRLVEGYAKAPTGARKAHRPGGGHSCPGAGSEGRARRRRSRAPVHVDEGCPEAGRCHCYLSRTRALPDLPGSAGRSSWLRSAPEWGLAAPKDGLRAYDCASYKDEDHPEAVHPAPDLFVQSRLDNLARPEEPFPPACSEAGKKTDRTVARDRGAWTGVGIAHGPPGCVSQAGHLDEGP